MLRFLGRCGFSKLTRQAVLGASYDQLANLIVKQYGNTHFRNSNSLALYQIQHHFKVISKGDWVLDLGAGPDYHWTDLALTLAEDDDGSHRVISSDLLSVNKPRPHNQFVRGDFHEEQVRAQIGAALGGKKFNSILIDVSPEFTGDLHADGLAINQLIFQALYFSNLFLEKGGNLVCKVLSCESTKVLQDNAKIFFHRMESFRPSVLRERSPVQFFVMRGFAINVELEAMREFLGRYRGGSKSKMELVREYQGKYSWDPVQILRNKAKNDIMMLKMQGKSDKEVENMFMNDPHIRPAEILKQIRAIDRAHANQDQTELDKAVHQFTDGKFSGEGAKVPNTREEWVTYLQTMDAKLKQAREAKKKKKGGVEKVKRNLEPLADNEVYMKDHLKSEEEATPPIYIESDLLGEYEQEQEKKYLQRELLKMRQNYPDQEKKLQEWKRKYGEDKPVDLEEVFGREAEREEAASTTTLEEEFHQLGDSLRAISDEQYKEIVDKQRYHDEREEFTRQSKANDRTKFRNR